MKISCLLLSHRKPMVHESIQSVLDQTHYDWELIVMDSGFHEFNYNDKRITFLKSEETEEIRRTKAIAPWCFNRMLPMTTGELIVYLCDDDIWYPNAFTDFNNFMERNPDFLACYASQDYGIYPYPDKPIKTGERIAKEIGGKGFMSMDCKVDYLQLCHRKSLLNLLSEWWNEDIRHKHHSDGILLDNIGQHTLIYPLPVKVGFNRRTEWSDNIPLR